MSTEQKTSAPNNRGNKLNANTKAFVPASNLKPTAPSFTPSNPSASRNAPSAWGKKPSSALRKPPPPQPQNPQPSSSSQQRNSQSSSQKSKDKDNGWRQSNKKDGGNWNQSGDGGRGGGGKRRDSKNNRGNRRNKKESNDNHHDGGWQRGKSLPVELLVPGDGKTDAEKAVKRITASDLLSLRLLFLDPPHPWSPAPPEHALWNADDRATVITTISQTPRMAGDVSTQRSRKKNDNDTAPPAEECAPLVVNDETRWKAKVFTGAEAKEDENSDDDVLKKALLILNKLSLTKFEKLSDSFIETGIGRNEACLKGAIGLVVDKAQQEPHFSAMYASLCIKLSKTPMEGLGEQDGKKGKKFKKMLLTRCQEEFEQDTATKIEAACKGVEDGEEKEYLTSIIKKNYLGHMRFIGELYKGDLVSIRIILSCIPHLLDKGSDGEVDEEKVECFSKLMTTIGASLEDQSAHLKSIGKNEASAQLADCWQHVDEIIDNKGPKGVSSRIRFMLQDLLEMRRNGWKTRRKEEEAKTLAQIHKEVAKEEAIAARSVSSGNLRALGQSSSSLRRGNSSSDVRRMSMPAKDDDGFTKVHRGSSVGFSRTFSAERLARSHSEGYAPSNSRRQSQPDLKGMKKPEPGKRSFSSGSFSALIEEQKPDRKGKSNKGADKAGKSKDKVENKTPAVKTTTQKKELPSQDPKPASELKIHTPGECKTKTKNILKEYFIALDTDDAVLSLHELICNNSDGSLERGAAVMESGTLCVMEMKKDAVEHFLTVLTRLLVEEKISRASILHGLKDPLEFLNDIIIDAPLASVHLCHIISQLIKDSHIEFESLLQAPEYFLTDGKPARFACQILKELGDEARKNEKHIEVIQKLMTEEDKNSYSSAEEIIMSV